MNWLGVRAYKAQKTKGITARGFGLVFWVNCYAQGQYILPVVLPVVFQVVLA